ncbi:hypothetical protein MP228_011560 [Amoeboaphelidium protococcarum]|nr:hypothetical protein MP228_011560 [Amoeboaphelidium protococcarum]
MLRALKLVAALALMLLALPVYEAQNSTTTSLTTSITTMTASANFTSTLSLSVTPANSTSVSLVNANVTATVTAITTGIASNTTASGNITATAAVNATATMTATITPTVTPNLKCFVGYYNDSSNFLINGQLNGNVTLNGIVYVLTAYNQSLKLNGSAPVTSMSTWLSSVSSTAMLNTTSTSITTTTSTTITTTTTTTTTVASSMNSTTSRTTTSSSNSTTVSLTTVSPMANSTTMIATSSGNVTTSTTFGGNLTTSLLVSTTTSAMPTTTSTTTTTTTTVVAVQTVIVYCQAYVAPAVSTIFISNDNTASSANVATVSLSSASLTVTATATPSETAPPPERPGFGIVNGTIYLGSLSFDTTNPASIVELAAICLAVLLLIIGVPTGIYCYITRHKFDAIDYDADKMNGQNNGMNGMVANTAPMNGGMYDPVMQQQQMMQGQQPGGPAYSTQQSMNGQFNSMSQPIMGGTAPGSTYSTQNLNNLQAGGPFGGAQNANPYGTSQSQMGANLGRSNSQYGMQQSLTQPVGQYLGGAGGQPGMYNSPDAVYSPDQQMMDLNPLTQPLSQMRAANQYGTIPRPNTAPVPPPMMGMGNGGNDGTLIDEAQYVQQQQNQFGFQNPNVASAPRTMTMNRMVGGNGAMGNAPVGGGMGGGDVAMGTFNQGGMGGQQLQRSMTQRNPLANPYLQQQQQPLGIPQQQQQMPMGGDQRAQTMRPGMFGNPMTTSSSALPMAPPAPAMPSMSMGSGAPPPPPPPPARF